MDEPVDDKLTDGVADAVTKPTVQLAMALDVVIRSIAKERSVDARSLARRLMRTAKRIKSENRLARALLENMAHNVFDVAAQKPRR